MSSILTEDVIKSSYTIKEQLENNSLTDDFFSSDEKFNELFDKRFDKRFNKSFETCYDERYEFFFREFILPLIEDNKSHKKEISELKEAIEILKVSLKMFGCDPSEVANTSKSNDETKHINEARAKHVFPILCEDKILSPGDIIRICKLDRRGHESAHRIMDMAEKLYPGECRHDTKSNPESNKSKHWLVHKDHIAFRK